MGGPASLLPPKDPTSFFPPGVNQQRQPWTALPRDDLLPPPPPVQRGWKSLQSSSRDSTVSPRQQHRPSTNAIALPSPLTLVHEGRVRLAAEKTLPVASQGAKAQAKKNCRAPRVPDDSDDGRLTCLILRRISRFRPWSSVIMVSEHCPGISLPPPIRSSTVQPSLGVFVSAAHWDTAHERGVQMIFQHPGAAGDLRHRATEWSDQPGQRASESIKRWPILSSPCRCRPNRHYCQHHPELDEDEQGVRTHEDATPARPFCSARRTLFVSARPFPKQARPIEKDKRPRVPTSGPLQTALRPWQVSRTSRADKTTMAGFSVFCDDEK